MNSGFQIKWLKIEEGDKATPYNESKVTIELIGHEPLRKVLNVADYIDYENSRIVRNIKEMKFDGSNDEKIEFNYRYSNDEFKCFCILLSEPYLVDNNAINSISSNFIFKPNIWDLNETGFAVQSSKKNGFNVLWFKVPNNIATNLNEIKTYLSRNPLTLLYQLEKPIYEPISPLSISTFEGLTTLEVSDNVPASKISVKYLTSK
ncbi:MAG: hypothetical protein RSD14_03090 [Clostridia bacterium]